MIVRRCISLLIAWAITGCIPPQKPDEPWYLGGPVPPGRRIAVRANPRWVDAGSEAVVFGYLLPLFPTAFSLATGGDGRAAISFIPVVGPLLLVHTVPPNEQPLDGGGREYAIAYTSAICQLAGVALLLAARTGARPALVPISIPGGAGAAITARF